MKTKSIALALTAGAFFLPGNVLADAGADLAKAKGCLGCHDIEKKKAGPPLKEIAAKKSGKGTELVAKLKDAKGHPKTTASEAELKTLVNWVLAQK